MRKSLSDVTLTNVGPLKPVDPSIEQYVRRFLNKFDEPVILEMEGEATARNFPIVGRNVGTFLQLMALAVGARRIFEFGSGFGYSAYWFLRALPEDGKIICTDADPENIAMARTYFERLGVLGRVDLRLGMAQDIFAGQEGMFDLIYNDVDKDAYPSIWRLARTKLRPGGLYLADNCLWGGRVTLAKVENDVVPGFTEAIKEHNQLIADDDEFEFFINPIRDGVIAARKKATNAAVS